MQPLYEEITPLLGIRKVEVGTMENNIYVVWDPASKEGYVLDGGYEPEAVAKLAEGIDVRAIVVTHGHKDHHEHVQELRDLLGAPVVIGEADAEMLSVKPDRLIADGDSLTFGPHELQAIHTPGHTPGSICYLLPVAHALFTGDTLFPGGPGNTRNDPQRFSQIIDSIRTRLFVLPDETTVRPGHGRDTTIGVERPQLEDWIARGW